MLQVPDGGSLAMASLTGKGTTTINGNGTLILASIVQDTLVIGGSTTVAPVPEPSTLVLLVLAGLALAGVYFRRK